MYVCKSVQNIRNTFLILSSCPFCTQNSLNSSGHGLCKVSSVFHRDAGPCRLQCFPQLCQVGWMSFVWWTILDTYGKLLSVKNPAALQCLTHSNRCAWLKWIIAFTWADYVTERADVPEAGLCFVGLSEAQVSLFVIHIFGSSSAEWSLASTATKS